MNKTGQNCIICTATLDRPCPLMRQSKSYNKTVNSLLTLTLSRPNICQAYQTMMNLH